MKKVNGKFSGKMCVKVQNPYYMGTSWYYFDMRQTSNILHFGINLPGSVCNSMSPIGCGHQTHTSLSTPHKEMKPPGCGDSSILTLALPLQRLSGLLQYSK